MAAKCILYCIDMYFGSGKCYFCTQLCLFIGAFFVREDKITLHLTQRGITLI